MEGSELIKAAREARSNGYAPYSKFCVGAALLTESGKIFGGCNIENISFGLTMCAERVCLGVAVSQAERAFVAIALVADSKMPIVPCGACRQVLAEFSPELLIYSATIDSSISEFRLRDLLPLPRQGILE